MAGLWRPLPGVAVRKNGGANVGHRPRLNLIEGSGVTLTVADDATDDEVDVTITATGGGGGGGALTYLAEVAVGAGGATSIDFTSIAGTYRDLVLVGRLRSDRAATPNDALNLRLGAAAFDTGNNYTYSRIQYGTHANTTQATGAAFIQAGGLDMPGATGLADHWSMFQIEILDYADTSFWRQVMIDSHAHQQTGMHNRGMAYGQWKNTVDAIQRVRLYPNTGPNFIEGSVATLYGRG